MAAETSGVVVSRTQLWLWIIGTLAVIGGVVWYFMNKAAKDKAAAAAVANNIADTAANVAAEVVKTPGVTEQQAKSAVLNSAQVVSPADVDITASVLEPDATAADLGTVTPIAEAVLSTEKMV